LLRLDAGEFGDLAPLLGFREHVALLGRILHGHIRSKKVDWQEDGRFIRITMTE